MNIPKTKPAVLALALGLAIAGIAVAQENPTPAQQKELDAARADLDKAAQHFAEVQRKYGGDAPFRIEKRMLRKPVIGVLLTPDETSGVRIAGVTPDSAAATGGLKSGDRVVSIDGKSLKAADGAARVEEARELLGAADTKTPVKLGFERDGKTRVVALTPKVGDRLLVVPDGAMFDGNVRVFAGETDEDVEISADRIRIDGAKFEGHARLAETHARMAAADARRQAEWAAAIAPDLRRDIVRLRSDCKGDDCKLPALAEAFRWNGLNLASVESGLGRYFGTDKGVLVLSTGKDLEGLQAGDVIQKIAGKPVNSPREAMDALRAQPAEGKVAVEYLRDRVTATAQVSVPKALPFTLPRSPVAPRASGVPNVVEHRKMVFVDKDGKRKEWEGNAGDTPPAWVQALPKDAKRVEKRVQVIVGDQGNQTVIEDDDLPPPPPPPVAPPPPLPPAGD